MARGKKTNLSEMAMEPVIHEQETGIESSKCPHNSVRGQTYFKSVTAVQCQRCKLWITVEKGKTYLSNKVAK